MEFGLYLTCYYGPGDIDEAALYRDTVACARLAEDVGFDSLSIPEHHFADYLTIPSPLMLAVKVAAETKHVPIITAVVVVPFYDITRLAGEIALADHLSDGRIELGLGRGAFRYEFESFEIDIPTSRPRFDEGVELLDRLLTEYDVSHEGTYYSIKRPITVMPRPRTHPRPKFWIATVSEQGIGQAVREGHNVLTTPLRSGFEVAIEQASSFINSREREGKPEQRHNMLRNVYVSTDRKDLAEKQQMLHENHRRFMNLFTTPGTIDRGRTRPVDVDIDAEAAVKNVIFGTPDEVIERVQRHVDLGIEGLQCNMHFGASYADAARSIELFATEVIPEFASTSASYAAPAELPAGSEVG
jgi:alkanesulfonate monooxygenase SsuD/methylene tetrahydromethanopterin reductase-like flavin-dependent oxidoreductase (luciferase family)